MDHVLKLVLLLITVPAVLSAYGDQYDCGDCKCSGPFNWAYVESCNSTAKEVRFPLSGPNNETMNIVWISPNALDSNVTDRMYFSRFSLSPSSGLLKGLPHVHLVEFLECNFSSVPNDIFDHPKLEYIYFRDSRFFWGFPSDIFQHAINLKGVWIKGTNLLHLPLSMLYQNKHLQQLHLDAEADRQAFDICPRTKTGTYFRNELNIAVSIEFACESNEITCVSDTTIGCGCKTPGQARNSNGTCSDVTSCPAEVVPSTDSCRLFPTCSDVPVFSGLANISNCACPENTILMKNPCPGAAAEMNSPMQKARDQCVDSAAFVNQSRNADFICACPKANLTELCMAHKCGNPVAPVNGQVLTNGNGVGNIAFFSCDPEFENVGGQNQTCTREGWSGQPARCQRPLFYAKPCDTAYLAFGNVYQHYYWAYPRMMSHMTGRRYQCLHGSGHVDFICNNGVLRRSHDQCNPAPVTASAPTGTNQCGNPVAPVNGRVLTNGTGLGSIALFSCDSGFVNVGGQNLTCTQEGWSGQPARCQTTSSTACDTADLAFTGLYLHHQTVQRMMSHMTSRGYQCLHGGTGNGYAYFQCNHGILHRYHGQCNPRSR